LLELLILHLYLLEVKTEIGFGLIGKFSQSHNVFGDRRFLLILSIFIFEYSIVNENELFLLQINTVNFPELFLILLDEKLFCLFT
jgi:hypothetical protein